LRIQICFDVYIFEVENGFDVDIFALQRIGPFFGKKLRTWATKNTKDLVTLLFTFSLVTGKQYFGLIFNLMPYFYLENKVDNKESDQNGKTVTSSNV
jgi:hypothetical protein